MSILTANACTDPLRLWDTFKNNICEDLTYTLSEYPQPGIPAEIEHPDLDYGLFLIKQTLESLGQTLEQYGLPPPVHTWDEVFSTNPLINHELMYQAAEERAALLRDIDKMNEGQRAAYNQIIQIIESAPEQAHFFIQGPAGTGKTFLYRLLCHYFRGAGNIVLCVASSGIAALLLPGGTTAHSRFKIPIKLDEFSTCSITRGTHLNDLLLYTSLII